MTKLQNLEWPSDAGYTSRGLHSLFNLLSSEELKAVPTQQVYHQDDQGQYINFRTNQVKQLCGLITYMKYIFESNNSGPDLPDDPFHPFSPDKWAQRTLTQMRTYLIQHLLDPLGLNPVPFGPLYPHQDLQVILQQQ